MQSVVLVRSICPVCGQLVPSLRERGQSVCTTCRRELRRSLGLIRLADIELEGGAEAMAVPVWALACYDGIVRHAIRALKYGGRRCLAPLFAAAITAATEAEPGLRPRADSAVVPVPATPRGRRQRGFDQMRLISARLPVPVCAALVHRYGQQQKQLDRDGRLRNAQHLFRMRHLPPPGALILDDVLTTGATLRSAAGMLYHAGRPPAAVLAIAARR